MGVKWSHFTGGLAFWLLYAASSGIIRYYSWNLAQYFQANPVFLTDFSSLKGAYGSKIIWFPGANFVVVLSLGVLFFSILLSSLFSISVLMVSHGLWTRGPGRKPGFVGFRGLFLLCSPVDVAVFLSEYCFPSTLLPPRSCLISRTIIPSLLTQQ